MNTAVAKNDPVAFRTWATLIGTPLRVRFRKVGQGDTIIIERWENGKLLLGIVDCKNYGEVNPVTSYLDYLQRLGVPLRIVFFVISHPHDDHFSGAAFLLEYLGRNLRIEFSEFVNSLRSSLDYLNDNVDERNEIRQIEKASYDLRKARKFRESDPGVSIYLQIGQKVDCFFHAPDSLYKDKVLRGIKRAIRGKNVNLSAAYNQLSTIISISHGNEYVLLTSDATKASFDELDVLLKEKLGEKRPIACQIPHHGSHRNFLQRFWRELPRRAQGTYAVFCVEDKRPKHPSKAVKRWLKRYGFLQLKPRSNQPRSTVSSNLALVEISSPVDSGLRDILVRFSRQKHAPQ